jgi:hypothetical protein
MSAITIALSVSGIGFHKNVPVKMEQKRCSWQTTIQFLPGTDEEEKHISMSYETNYIVGEEWYGNKNFHNNIYSESFYC